MKKGIHPEYYDNTKVTCACGESFITGSTVKEIRVELCGKCHPFYTGKQKFVDTARRVEKFQERAKKTAAVAAARKGKKASAKAGLPTKSGEKTTAKTKKNIGAA